MDDVTFGITHYLRPDDLLQCMESIRAIFPDAIIDTEDTDGNLSKGRNRLVTRCQTPYFFMIEEDMRLRPDTNIDAMRRILEQRSDILGVGGAIFEPKNGIRCIAAQYRKTQEFIIIEDAVDRQTTNEGDAFIVCSLIYNYGLFRTSDLKSYKWNEQLELAEHYEFYLHVQERGVHRIACCHSTIDHLNTRPNASYTKARRRIGDFRRTERRILKRKLIRQFSEHLLQSSPIFRAVIVGGTLHDAAIASDIYPGPLCGDAKIQSLINGLPDTPGRWKHALHGNLNGWKIYVEDMRKALQIAERFKSYRLPLLYLPARTDDEAAYLNELLHVWPFSVIPLTDRNF